MSSKTHKRNFSIYAKKHPFDAAHGFSAICGRCGQHLSHRVHSHSTTERKIKVIEDRPDKPQIIHEEE